MQAIKSTNLLKINDITPIEKYNGIFYKRDDKYRPFQDVPISGGKVRQALSLIHKNYEIIKHEYDGLVATATSPNSPQGIVVARAAKEFGFNCIVVFGGTSYKMLRQNTMVKWVLDAGANLDLECKLGYDTTLSSRIKQLKEQAKGRLYHVKFGINLENNADSIINSIAYQVQNLPQDLDNLIIPTGSAITAGGILVGLKQYNIKVKKVIIVQIAGYNREETLHKIFDTVGYSPSEYPDYQYVADKTYAYSKQLKIKFNKHEYLDPVYEAKGYDWMLKNVDYKNEKTLFWIIGNSFYVRTIPPHLFNLH